MDSLEIIKQQLIKQKNLLDKKGIAVTVTNKNPSPSDITTALENLSFDFTQTTATEEDVKAGKTFYAQNSEIKTGTFDLSMLDQLKNKIKTLISATGSLEIIIPDGCTRIRKYAFQIDTSTGDIENVFYSTNLIIPESVKYIGERAFFRANITGTLIVPETCEKLSNQCFNGIKITEVYINNGFTTYSVGTYAFTQCPNLKRAIFGDANTAVPNYTFYNCTSLEFVQMPKNFKELNAVAFSECPSLKIIKFTGTKPGTFMSKPFSKVPEALLMIPYLYYDTYVNASNFLVSGNPVCGYGSFDEGDKLPTGIEGYTAVWYSNTDDLLASANPITHATTTGEMYCSLTEISNEEETTNSGETT